MSSCSLSDTRFATSHLSRLDRPFCGLPAQGTFFSNMLSAAIRRRVLAPTQNVLRTGFASHVVRCYASFPDHQVVKMPALSPTMQAGNIGAWQKKAGDTIAPGDVLVEIETDKAQMDFEFQEDGVLAKILEESGAKDIAVGHVSDLLSRET